MMMFDIFNRRRVAELEADVEYWRDQFNIAADIALQREVELELISEKRRAAGDKGRASQAAKRLAEQRKCKDAMRASMEKM